MRRVPTVVWCGLAVVVLLVGWVPVAMTATDAERADGELQLYRQWSSETTVVDGSLVEVGRSQEVLPGTWDTPVTYGAKLEGRSVRVTTSMPRRVDPDAVPEHQELRIAPDRIRAGEVAAVQSGDELDDAAELAADQIARVDDTSAVATIAAGVWWVAAALLVIGLLLVGRWRGAAGFAGERPVSEAQGRYDGIERAARSLELPFLLGTWALLTCLAALGFTILPMALAWGGLTLCVVAAATVREVRALRALIAAPPGIVRRRRRSRAMALRALGAVPLLLSLLLLMTLGVMARAIGPEAGRELTLAVVMAVVGLVSCGAAVAQSRVPQAPVIPPRANSGTPGL